MDDLFAVSTSVPSSSAPLRVVGLKTSRAYINSRQNCDEFCVFFPGRLLADQHEVTSLNQPEHLARILLIAIATGANPEMLFPRSTVAFQDSAQSGAFSGATPRNVADLYDGSTAMWREA